MALTGCDTINNIRSSETAKTAGSFQLNPVQPNNYWYNGTTYEYNAYEIKIISQPIEAKIKWEGRYIGTTPLVYKFTGSLDQGDQIHVQAVPLDEKLQAREASLKIQTELPREIHFDFNHK